MDTKVLDQIFESLNVQLESQELKDKVGALVEELVNSRATILSEEIKKENEQLTQTCASLKEEMAAKEEVVTEEVKKFAEEHYSELASKEAILLEEIENYKKDVEQAVTEGATEFRESVEKVVREEAQKEILEMAQAYEAIILEESANFKAMLENVTMEELSSYTEEQEAELAKEVNTFKEDMVESVSQFLEAELKQNIPKEIMESAVKLSAYEPLVEGILSTFSKNYVKVDSPAYDALKNAKAKIEELSESITAKSKDNVRLAERLELLEKKSKVQELTEGMTIQQRTKAVKFLESVGLKDMESKFNQVKDLIIAESVQKVSTVETTATSKQTAIADSKKIDAKIQKKLESLNESVISDPEMATWSKTLRTQLKAD